MEGEYTFWKRCESCGYLNLETHNRCHHCGLMLFKKKILEEI